MGKKRKHNWDEIKKLADGTRTSEDIAKEVGCTLKYARKIVRELNLNVPKIKGRGHPKRKHNWNQIASLCDGKRMSKEIAEIVGCSAKYVQEVMLKMDLPRRRRGGRSGDENHQWKGGRHISLDGYAYVQTPKDHPRTDERILEHRLLMEEKLGRYLRKEEVVDHIDGLQLHNHPDNLRLFASNSDHLKATISGQVPHWSQAGVEVLDKHRRLQTNLPRVDNYRRAKESGVLRLQQILLLALQLGTDSPYLLGTNRWLKKNDIDLHSNDLRQTYLELCQQYELNPRM